MKTALVTGGSRGIGKAIAQKLSETSNVAVGYSNSKEQAVEVVNSIQANGGNAIAVQIDVTDNDSVEKCFELIEKEFSSVEILVNNAGITKDNIFPRLKQDDWDSVIDTNLTGSFRTSQRAIKGMMKNKWGRILFISSVAGISGNTGQSNYAASKAGMIGLAKTISKELGSRNITSNVIAPGYIDTDMTSFLNDEQKEEIIGQLSIKRVGKPEDIANMVAFLCSDESEYITGQVFPVDGGLTT
ncbi:MAG: 3-oxoacyl-[acyl-carrier-protein] reductase [Actinobacteria bacterium]|jgi:3-oxoacyl-[acyl-carrier protein] reductase|nr:3-oxoacyl-[acyl-carrier-protein] reductase [Actinomycetota bacterium]MBT5655225.1 3-oxoacyl-[acyl-carrier-protein] reductase [Actinomycetota bacterium]MBT7013959.1 3-oxoacyl-[acyl-carrier-protein] reductase [Actinomycetota bacterium]MDA9637087.1 3-oxoacyl-[acyl-carrier-protein] reductase [bacterium]